MAEPLFRKIDCLMLPVPDVEEALAFYRDRLGQPLLWKCPTAAAVGFPDSSAELVLRQSTEAPEVDIMVDSAPEAAEKIVAAGGSIVAGPFDIRIGKCVVVRDPFGNVLVLLDSSKGLLKTDSEGNVL